MQLHFSKYQGTGNDFILIDNRKQVIDPKNFELFEKLCDRRFGIGADGLMLLENDPKYDFRMRYYNSDGKEGSMCGNGGRCIVAFAYHLGIIKSSTKFIAVDGEHNATIFNSNNHLKVSINMIPVTDIEIGENYFYLNTGSPHYVQFIDSHDQFDTYQRGKEIRYNNRFAKEGTNVNFVSSHNNSIQVSTYERGVENETYSCGTGVVAASISNYFKTKKTEINIITKGGDLHVRFAPTLHESFDDIWLTGPATLVFNGDLNI